MKKYLSLILFIVTTLFVSYTYQANALMACHTGSPNQFGNDVISLTSEDCCEQYSQHNPQCSFNIGTCMSGGGVCMLMDKTECAYEGGTWFSGTNCTNTTPSTPSCTITNGIGKFQNNYANKYVAAGEAVAADIIGISVCNPMPNAGDSCRNRLDSCKANNTTNRYLECDLYDTGTDSCVVDTCDPGYIQDGNACIAGPEKGVCSTVSQSCTTGNYVNLADTASAYKWQCSGLNDGLNVSCELTIPVTPQAGSCSATHYGCSLGTSINNMNGSTQWTWDCQGTNLGATTSCIENKNLTVVPPTVSGDWLTQGATSSANDDTKFAGMSNQTKYVLEWCTPHKIELEGAPTGECISKYFTDEGGKAVLPMNGGANNLSIITDNMGFEIKGEGVLTINTYATDYAHNITEKKFIYKVDKTAPRFGDFVFTEVSGNQYMNVETYDIAEDGQPGSLGVLHASTQDDGYTFPLTNTYTKASSTENPYSQNVSKISKVRYKQTGLGTTSPVINVALSGATDTFGGTAHFNYVSRADRIDFYKGNSVPGGATGYQEYTTIDLTETLTNQKELDLDTFVFSKGGTPTSQLDGNDGTFINVRLTDNAGNYSEKAFYVYRDEAVPVVGDFEFNFEGDTNGLKLSGKTESRYVLANKTTKIDYDWGMTNDHMASGIDMYIENTTQSSIDISNMGLSQKVSIGNSVSGTSTNNIDLSIIDTDLKKNNTGENYRNYEIQFRTPGIAGNKICDAAGNCIDGNTVLSNFRAIANNINKVKSNLNITHPNNIFAGNYNNNNYNNSLNTGAKGYNILYTLKDQFGNSIRQIFADGIQIRDNKSILSFENGLNQKQIDLDYTNIGLGYGVNSYAGAVLVKGTEIEGHPGGSLELDDKLILVEANTSSNGVFQNELLSAIPTVGGYKYMKNDAILELSKIKNTVSDNASYVYQGAVSNTDIDYTSGGNGKYYDITDNITENENNRFNLTINSLNDYGKVSPVSYIKNLTFASDILNFEFSSPFIYHAENLNILRDGIDSEYKKVFETKYGGSYETYERFFDVNTKNNSQADFYVDGTEQNIFKKMASIFNPYKVQYKAKAGTNFEEWGYVSYINYNVGGNKMHIPAISRGISANNDKTKSSAYYPNVNASGGISSLTQDIAITGLVNKIDGLSRSNQQIGLASLDLKRPYTRAQLLEKLKKKIFTVNKIGNWCGATVTTLNETVGNSSSCTFNINGEIISFYDDDITIDCGNTCEVSDKRTIIVKGGRVTIKSNINTDTDGQFLIASITDKGLSDVTIMSDYNDIDTQEGWIAIDQQVTNINAFLLAQGPIVSSDNGDNVIINYNTPTYLLNQLHIYGSVFSLNTISGDKTGECPYIETSCDQNNAKIYDLSFLRRYALVDAGQFNGTPGKMVPFDPGLNFVNDPLTATKSSGGFQYNANGDTTPNTSTLKTAKTEHLYAPVIVERDNKWSTSPSYFAKD